MYRPLLCSLLALAMAAPALAAEPIPPEHLSGGFAIGCQAYTFKEFSTFEAIAKTAEAGGKVIEFYPGQKLSPEEPGTKWDHNATPETIEKVKAKLKEHNILAVAYGVVGIPTDETAARKIFTFARTMGIRVINTESTDAIDTIEKMVREFDIKVGYHNHPRRPDNPDYKVWDPNYIATLIRDRDQRIGACADTGHWVRTGLKPVECLNILRGRIVASHLKDLDQANHRGHDVPYGNGVSDIPGILAEYRSQGFIGPISVEYEHRWTDNVGEVKQCIAFVRAAGEKKP